MGQVRVTGEPRCPPIERLLSLFGPFGVPYEEILKIYLAYINANLIISNEVGSGFHDWADFYPFYHRKFLSVGVDSMKEEERAKASRGLFEVAFPEFEVRDPKQLLRIMTHKRVGELRALVQEAADGRVQFDESFARSVYREVVGIERQTNRVRKLVSYATLPVGFLPFIGNVAQVVIDETLGSLLERRLKKRHRWFYMLSDMTEPPATVSDRPSPDGL